jgi:hypothetical protein
MPIFHRLAPAYLSLPPNLSCWAVLIIPHTKAATGSAGAPPDRRLLRRAALARRDFVHVERSGRSLPGSAESGRPGEIYNLASGDAVDLWRPCGPPDRFASEGQGAVRLERDGGRERSLEAPI